MAPENSSRLRPPLYFLAFLPCVFQTGDLCHRVVHDKTEKVSSRSSDWLTFLTGYPLKLINPHIHVSWNIKISLTEGHLHPKVLSNDSRQLLNYILILITHTASPQTSLTIKANSINRGESCADVRVYLITAVPCKAGGLGGRLLPSNQDARRKTVTLANNYGC